MFSTRRRFVPLFLLGLFLPLAGALAQETGTVTGRVLDAPSQAYLEGVIVTVPQGPVTHTSRGGYFSLSGVPAGSQEVEFRFMSRPVETRTVEVPAGGAVDLPVRLAEDVVQLDSFQVRGQAFGQALALGTQRSSENLKNVVSADELGRFPDQNAAESLNRLPGISVERDQGEGRFVVVRGINPALNAVAIDGVALAAPNTGSRATLLDTIPSETLQTVEVTKAPLPSDPGDGIGGYINIKTPSAFDRAGTTARLAVQGDYTDLTSDWKGKISGAYGDTFGADGQFGWIVNASYEERSFGSDNQEADPWSEEEGDDGQDYWINDASLEFREYDLTRTRTGLSTNFEYRPSADHQLFLRASYNEFEDEEVRQRTIFIFDEEYEDADGEDQDLSEFSSIGPDGYTVENAAVERHLKDRTETMTIWVASAGGRHQLGDWQLDYTASYSYAEEDTPDDREFVYQSLEDDFADIADNPDVRVSQTAGYHPRVTFLAGTGDSPYDPDSFGLDGVEEAMQNAEEKQWSAQFNLRREFDWNDISYLQFGGLLRSKNKVNQLEVYENDEEPEPADELANFTRTGARDPFQVGIPFIHRGLTAHFLSNRAGFEMERKDDDSTIEDYDSQEDVRAGYAMFGYGRNTASLIAGFRVEQTEYETSGSRWDADAEEVVPVRFSDDYTNFLPGVHGRLELARDLILRLSWTNAIARPSFEEARPGQLFEDDEVEAGNPALDPYEAMNWDASLEYYLPSLGVLSAAVFRKDVDNFIYVQTIPDGITLDGDDYDLSTYRNGESGDITGLELAYQQQFTILPSPFDGLGLYSNLTLTDSSATVPGPEQGDPSRELPFLKQSEWVGNLALTYEKYGLFLRLATTWRSEYLDEVGEESAEDRYIDDHLQLDLSASYDVTEQFTVFGNLLNLTNEPLRAYWGESGRLSQFEEYGWSANLGVRWNY